MRRRSGFTLVELVTVIAIIGVLAASVTAFLIPAVNSYFDTKRRASLTDMADTALRRMSFDIRRAVPNSIVPYGGTCIKLVPTSWGGRYRLASDTVNDVGIPCNPSATCSAPLDVGGTRLDVLSLQPSAPDPAAGDFVVINNTGAAGGDVYATAAPMNRAAIAAGGVTTPRATDGVKRLTLAASPLPLSGYDQGRFVIVPSAEQVVYYSCDNGSLLRNVVTFAADAANPGAACGAGVPVATVQAVNAGDGVGCLMVYNSGATATEQNGLVWTYLILTEKGESVSLSQSTNVPNVP
jgi:MSHA biogenesis protein MshO